MTPSLSSTEHSLIKTHVCLICYQRFRKSVPLSPLIKVKVETSLHDNDPLKILTEEDDNQGNVEEVQNDKQSSTRSPEDTYRRFLRFAERYLKLRSNADYFSYHANLLKRRDISDDGRLENIEAFCSNCRDTISNVCGLHQDIEERQLRLLERLDSLGDSMKRSTKKMSLKMEKSLGKVLAEQLNVKAVTRVLTFRKVIQLKCGNRMTRNVPKVVIHRGLFPDQWKYSFTATKKTLARLIFVFCLAYWSGTVTTAPKISEIPPKLEDSLPNAPFVVGNDNVPKTKIRKRRKPARKPEVAVKKETEEIIKKENLEDQIDKAVSDDDDHEHDDHSPSSPFNNTEDNSDPDWQSQSPPLSPDYQVSSSSNNEDSSDPDFQTSVTSKKRRRVTRRTSKTLSCNTTDPESTSTSMASTKRRRRGRPRRNSPRPPPKNFPFHCDKCPGKSFQFHKGLRIHLRKIHHIIAEFPCELCGVMVKHSVELLLHKQKMHPGERQVKKQVKGQQSFRKKRSWTAHSTTVGHECKKCGKFFANGPEFQTHWRLVHSKRKGDFLEGEEPSPNRKKIQGKEIIPRRPRLIRRENKELWTKCEICGYEDKGFELKKHLEDKHEKEDDKKLLCYFCNKRFTVQQTLNLHVRAGHMGLKPKPVFYCHFEDECEQPFLTWPELHEHMKKHLEGIGEVQEENKERTEGKGPKKKIFYCELCGWGTFFENYVDVHKMQHEEQRNGMYYCTKCVAGFERKASLTSHYNKVHGGNVQPFKCKFCGVRTASRSGMDIHIYDHKQQVEVEDGRERVGGRKDYKIKVCGEEGCGKSFRGMKLLTEHLEEEHEKMADYSCDICLKRFYMPCLLKYHMRMHREPEFECNICHVKFKRRLTMERHKTEKHLQEEDTEGHMKCSEDDCNKMFVTRNLMHRHLARIHKKGPLVHMCQLCGQIFLTNSCLTAHMRFHEDPQWECEICHKQLKRGISLQKHMELFHNPDRVYEQFICPTCGKIYKSKQGLQFHMDSAHLEESERRFACPNCPRKFHRPSLFHMHFKNCKTNEGEEGQSSAIRAKYQMKPKAKGLTKKMMEFRRKQKMNMNTASEQPCLRESEQPAPPPPQNSLEQVAMATNDQHVMFTTSSGNTNESYQQFFNS